MYCKAYNLIYLHCAREGRAMYTAYLPLSLEPSGNNG